MADTTNALSAINPTAERALYAFPTSTVASTIATGAPTATLAAVTGKQHCITAVHVSFGATITSACTLTINDGATVIWQLEIPTATAPLPLVLDFQQRPLHGSVGAAMTAALTTPGSIKSTVNVAFFSVGAP